MSEKVVNTAIETATQVVVSLALTGLAMIALNRFEDFVK